MKKQLLALVLALVPMLGFSQHRSESDAIAVAQGFWGGKVNRAQLKAVPRSGMAKAKAKVQENVDVRTFESGCYVVNDTENGRFAIVSAHERMNDILGYSDEGLFDVDNIAPGLMDILLSYDAAFAYLMEHPEAEVAGNEDATESYTPVEPLLKTKWGQGYPYNLDCPVINDKYCETGCGATALAQILNYYRSSTHGSGELRYSTESKHIEQYMNFEELNLNWDAIQDTYDDRSTEEQSAEVAKLMHACGVSLAMNYNVGGSGSNYGGVGYALTKFWNYNPNIAYKHTKIRYDEPLEVQMRNELSKGHPIFAVLIDLFLGHAAVVDGYDSNGWFHYNFGWEGIGDGYYDDVRFVKPVKEDGKSMGYDFYKNHYILNISPEECGEPDTDYFVAEEVPTVPSSIAIGSELELKYTIDVYDVHTPSSSYGLNEHFSAEIGFGLFNEDGTLASDFFNVQGRFTSGMSFGITYRKELRSSDFKEGERYYLTQYYKLEGSDEYYWIKNNAKWGYLEGYYVVSVKDGILYLVRGDEYTPDSFKEVVTHNETAGQLADNVNIEELNGAAIWSISGNLNGTDIKHILSFEPTKKLVCLNLSECNIVEGGDAYYKETDIEYFTEANVVGPEMFQRMGNVSTIKLPLTTQIIRNNAIHNNMYLSSLVVPDACEVVEDSAIYSCGDLTTIHLGKNVKEFGAANGINCYDLLCFSVDDDNTAYRTEDGILYSFDGTILLRCPMAHSNNKNKTFTVPDEVAKIGDYAFCGFKAADAFELHDGLLEIGRYAFDASSLISLNLPQNVSEVSEGLCKDASYLYSAYLPKSIKVIHPKAFAGCKSLKNIDSEICDIESAVIVDGAGMSDAFQGISAKCHWRVPLGSAEVYKAQKWWVDTWTVEEDVPESIGLTFGDGLEVRGARGGLLLNAGKSCDVNIYDLQGKNIRRTVLPRNSSYFIPLANGVYIVNGQKIKVN